VKISIIVPVLNEAQVLAGLLEGLAPLRARGSEIIVVDGGSTDASVDIATERGVPVITAPRGRARQMNAGAVVATGDVLLFLHADTRLPPDADSLVARQLTRSGRSWGRFDVRVSGRCRLFPLIGLLISWRSRLTGIATGDQAMFVTRSAFDSAGGFADLPLMEDVDLSQRLKRLDRPVCIGECVSTSGRRWETRGVWRTIILMWRLRWDYWRGVPAAQLADRYR
jgi:rSAM/selenodomain-associated transferase 2